MARRDLRVDQRVRRSVRRLLREALITGMAVVVPLLITVIVLAIAFQYVYRYLNLFSTVVLSISKRIHVPLLGTLPQQTVIELITPVVLVVSILVVGVLVNSSRYGQRAVDYFDYAIAQIPGIGSVYDSFRKMSDVVIESDTQNFRDVKLVEFPHEGTYTLGFVTTETPPQLTDPAGHGEMLTLFLPLAPNPVMGGHLVHVPADRVHDVDMSVEEGVRAVVTSGVAVGRTHSSASSLSPDELRDLGSAEFATQQLDPSTPSNDVPRPDPNDARRADSYDRVVSPASATTADDIARRASPAPTSTDSDHLRHFHEDERAGGSGIPRSAGYGDARDTDAFAAGDPATTRDDEPGDSATESPTPMPSNPTPAEIAGRPDLAARAFGLDADADADADADDKDERESESTTAAAANVGDDSRAGVDADDQHGDESDPECGDGSDPERGDGSDTRGDIPFLFGPVGRVRSDGPDGDSSRQAGPDGDSSPQIEPDGDSSRQIEPDGDSSRQIEPDGDPTVADDSPEPGERTEMAQENGVRTNGDGGHTAQNRGSSDGASSTDASEGDDDASEYSGATAETDSDGTTTEGADAAVDGAGSEPDGADSAPDVADAAPDGADSAPDVADAAPDGADAETDEADSAADGTDVRSSDGDVSDPEVADE